ncbi:6157_t:CDS:2 [Ambispora leptoticha]|uniref:6157_t:CDS:1 n=1 Tax=Ambispora leptoticha TaxID=144679 RepID=A0A9N9BLQ9_9GLOM|nr:6157_t:CDS:2 [Ambispora leptoticha]
MPVYHLFFLRSTCPFAAGTEVDAVRAVYVRRGAEISYDADTSL